MQLVAIEVPVSPGLALLSLDIEKILHTFRTIVNPILLAARLIIVKTGEQESL